MTDGQPAFEDPFAALGDANRRRIVELLADRSRSVRELADEMPISRPAVSRHLRLLKQAAWSPRRRGDAAHLPAPRPRGRRRRGLRPRDLGRRRDPVPAHRREHHATTTPMIEPLRISFEVACDQEHAFDTWTTRFGTWWPAGHTVSRRPRAEVVLEPVAGGRIFERTPDGTEIDWGEIVACDPPAPAGLPLAHPA